MNPNYLVRQRDIIPEDCLDVPITVIGAGSVGGLTVLALAKMGYKRIHVWDFDEFSDVNMNSQLCRERDLGRLKVKALELMVKDFTGTEIKGSPAKYVGDEIFQGIVISALDSMAGRALIWNTHCGQMGTHLVIDPRMGAEVALLYAMDPNSTKDQEAYQTTLYTDENAEQVPCTAKATFYTAMLLAGMVAKTVKDYTVLGNYPRVTQWSIKDDQFVSHKHIAYQGDESVTLTEQDTTGTTAPHKYE